MITNTDGKFRFTGDPEAATRAAFLRLCAPGMGDQARMDHQALVTFCARQCAAGYGRSLIIEGEGAPLHVACSVGYTEIARACVRGGHDPNLQVDGIAPIHYLMGQGECAPYGPLIDLLATAGADLTAETGDGYAPIILAARNGNDEALARLVKHGVDLNYRDTHGMSALHYAVITRGSAAVTLLLLRGAQVNAINIHGTTPLHCAESVEILISLLLAGADVSRCDVHRRAPLAHMTNHMKGPERIQGIKLLFLAGARLTGVDWLRRGVMSSVQQGWKLAAPDMRDQQKSSILGEALAEGGVGAGWAAKELARLSL